jgi:hypothetical protein
LIEAQRDCLRPKRQQAQAVNWCYDHHQTASSRGNMIAFGQLLEIPCRAFQLVAFCFARYRPCSGRLNGAVPAICCYRTIAKQTLLNLSKQAFPLRVSLDCFRGKIKRC